MHSSGLGTLLASLRDGNNRHVRLTPSGTNRIVPLQAGADTATRYFEIRPTVQEALLT
jgi:hypothetical protein